MVLISAIRVLFYYRKHLLLKRLEKSISDSVSELPEPTDLIESDYIGLIKILAENKADIISEKDRTLSEMTDYYTLWAHQIKTPIAAMRLLLQEREGDSTELSEQLFRIEQYADMVLGYLRTESMSSDLVLKCYSLDDIVRQAVRKYARTFIRKRIPLEYSQLDMTVLTDEKWLLFVIEQLLSNSLKYTKAGKISIYRGENEPMTLVISDTGIGIRPEDLPRLGERGFTGYNGRGDKKSTGIGFYLCKKILVKLSHTIRVESEVGVGTKVIIGFTASEK